MTKEISIGLFNYKNGGRTASNGYEFTKLQQAFEPVKKEAPDIILINEAKGWKADGHTVLHMAVNALSEKLRDDHTLVKSAMAFVAMQRHRRLFTIRKLSD